MTLPLAPGGQAPIPDDDARQLKFRDPAKAAGLAQRLEQLATAIVAQRERPTLSVMHVCGSHEQAIAKYGLRQLLPRAVDLIMGPGCPVCVTDQPEVDEAVWLARSGVEVATYGDMLRVPGTSLSLADAQAAGGRVHVVYGVTQAVELARKIAPRPLVFFASGFETTAVTTAAALVAQGSDRPPANFSVLSAHKFIPPAMEIVAQLPGSRIEGYVAAGHAATITGYRLFEPIAARHQVPIVVAGFEPLDILAALVRLLELIAAGQAVVENLFPRCVTRDGNLVAQKSLWQVFEPLDGRWRGIAEIPDGNLRLRPEFAEFDARRRFKIEPLFVDPNANQEHVAACRCGEIMAGQATPFDCRLFGRECVPDHPIGACMVSNEGTCKIWHLYGGRPDLRASLGAEVSP